MRIERDRRRVLMVVAAVGLVCGLGVYLPARHTRAGLEARAEQARQEIGYDASKTSLRELHDQVAELRLGSHETQRYVPRTDELAEVLRGLTESLQAFGATVHEVVVGDIRHHRDYSTIPMKLRFDGSFPGAYGVLKQIEAMNRLIRVERLSLDTSVSDASSPVRVDLELTTFYTPDRDPGKAGGT